jgi:hypothetical protein
MKTRVSVASFFSMTKTTRVSRTPFEPRTLSSAAAGVAEGAAVVALVSVAVDVTDGVAVVAVEVSMKGDEVQQDEDCG